MSIIPVASGAATSPVFTTSLTVAKPGSAQAGDVMIVEFPLAFSTTIITPPNGWATILNQGLARFFARVIEAGDTSWVFTSSSSMRYASYAVWRGCDPATPVGATGYASGAVAPTVTTTRDNSLLVAYCLAAGSLSISFTPPGGMTERLDYNAAAVELAQAVTFADEARATAGATGTRTFVPSGGTASHSVSIVLNPPPPPTIGSITPAKGPPAGGTALTITGTGFTEDTTVTVDGNPATSVSILSSTELTCVTPAGSGAVDVAVTNAAGTATASGGFTYVQVRDTVLKLVVGGAVVGDNKAATTTDWPGNPASASYGGASDDWGATLTPAAVNAADFGVVLSVTAGAEATAKVDRIRMRVHYTVPGVADPATYVAVLRVDADRATARPDLYKLARSGLTVGNDPQIDRALPEGGEWRLPRIDHPGRTVEKVWHSWECYLGASVEANTPGLQWWARVDDGPRFQLLDRDGNAATLRTAGAHEVYFPASDVSRGKYVQLIAVVPAVVGDQVAAAYELSHMALQLAARPKMTEVYTVPLLLRQGEFEDRTSMTRSALEQMEELKALVRPGMPAVALKNPQGEEAYAHVVGLSWAEDVFKGEHRRGEIVANVTIRMARYG